MLEADMRLAGGVSLVTGASAGIGAAVATRLCVAGAHVLVHGRDADRTATVAEATGGTPLLAELADPAGVDALVDQALAVHGRVDLLVANAGRGHSGPFAAMATDDIEELLAVDLAASIRLTRLLLPGMLERGRGHLCYVTSIAGRTGVAGEAVYAAAKAGLDAFAESLRLELAGSGVGVTVVVPAAVATGFFDARGRPYDRRNPRPVTPEHVAKVVVEAVELDRDEVFVPGWTRIAPAVRAVAPSPFRALSRRFGEQVRSDRGGRSGGGDR
ncbi:SDR family NAD(P)-dependent oxidoreductase [Nocardioides cheoyonin]|uniref:SDR family NAD(P)-dependent oxidoreductase n=1 Tax=Nocardioides cheoyonin TaxID=3156615 RepID=UPI0032B45CE4